MVGYVMTDGVCTNIDECADVEDPCDIQNSNAFCVDIEGGFQCICDSGFTGASGIGWPRFKIFINCANTVCDPSSTLKS